MADEKSILKMNKMIHKKTGASFLVVYVIYVSLVYTDSKKTASCLLPRHTIFATSVHLFHQFMNTKEYTLTIKMNKTSRKKERKKKSNCKLLQESNLSTILLQIDCK